MIKNTGKDFELLVKSIYEEIISLEDYNTIDVKHNVNLIGKSGQFHQIDIYWEFQLAGIIHKVAIECKEYKNKVSVGKIRDFFGVIEDIGNIRGIFITTNGYQSGAIKYAEHKNISLKVVKKPTKEELSRNQSLKKIILNIHRQSIKVIDMQILVDWTWMEKTYNIKPNDSFSISCLTNELQIIDKERNDISSIFDLESQLPNKPEDTNNLSFEFKYINAYLYHKTKLENEVKIKAIKFTYNTETSISEEVMNFRLLAHSIMQDIITGEEYLYNASY